MKSLIQKCVEINGPSGFEKPVREMVQSEIEGYVDEIQVDALGNLIARKGTKKGTGKRLLLAAHIDEIGLMASFIDEHGFIRFTNIGGIFPIHCVGSRVRFFNGVPGVIGLDKYEKTTLPDLSQMYIDVGATGREDCPIRIGDAAVFERPFVEMGNHWVSKAMDDRVGVAILIQVIRELKQTPHEVYCVFSTQEELGTRGITTAAYQIEPDLGLSIDVTRTGDTPKGIKMEVALDKGPAIKVRDSGMIADPRLVELLTACSRENHIPYQLEVLEAGTTDARVIQLTRCGVPSGCISIPCRYIHSPSEMVSRMDVENAVKLLVNFLSGPIQY